MSTSLLLDAKLRQDDAGFDDLGVDLKAGNGCLRNPGTQE